MDALPEEGLSLGDRKNMAYKGTFVTYGRGMGVVVAIGMATEFGKIAAMLQDEEEVKTPLQKRLAVFGRKLALAVLAICVIVLGIGLLRGEPPLLMLMVAISLAVAAIPEALPAVITISLALGAKKLIKLQALIRKLPAVETLGSVTYICSDKTGTLTQNRMSVTELYYDGRLLQASDFSAPDPSGQTTEHTGTLLMTALALSNDAEAANGGQTIGDPTETALFHVARQHGFDKKVLETTSPARGGDPLRFRPKVHDHLPRLGRRRDLLHQGGVGCPLGKGNPTDRPGGSSGPGRRRDPADP